MASQTTVPVTARVPSDLKQALLRLAAQRGTNVSELLSQLSAVAVRDEGKGFAAMLESAERLAAAQTKLAETEALLEVERAAHEHSVRALIEAFDQMNPPTSASFRRQMLDKWKGGQLKSDPGKWKQ